MGQEKYQSLNKFYIRDAALALLTYDVNNINSFKNLNRWIEIIGNEITHELLIFIVANKVDDPETYEFCNGRRQVTEKEGSDYAKNITFVNAEYFEVSEIGRAHV